MQRAVFLGQRHASAALLLAVAPSRGDWAAWAVPLAFVLYLAANRAAGRMAATAATFVYLYLGGPMPGLPSAAGLAASCVASAAVGFAASALYQWAEGRFLKPWARRRGWRMLLEGTPSVLFWSAALLALTAAAVWLTGGASARG